MSFEGDILIPNYIDYMAKLDQRVCLPSPPLGAKIFVSTENFSVKIFKSKIIELAMVKHTVFPLESTS